MLDCARVELQRVVDLVGPVLVLALPTGPAAGDHRGCQQRIRVALQPRCRGPQVALVVAVAQDVLQLRIRTEAMYVRRRRDRRLIFLVVGVGETVVRTRDGYGQWAPLVIRDAVVGNVVLVEVVKRDVELVARAESPCDRRRHTPALVMRTVAEAFGVGAHRVDAHRRVVADNVVDVGHRAHVVEAADGDRRLALVHQERDFAHLVHDATSRPAAEQHRR